MINLILIFPLIACLFLALKKDCSGSFLIKLYAAVHFIISFCFCAGFDLMPFWHEIEFFSADETNKLFLMVLSIVYLAFAFYNSGYNKVNAANDGNRKSLRRYAFMVLCFVFSMTGALLSSNLGAMWVFIEGTTLASAYLIYFDKTKHSIEAAWKYVFICSIGISLAFIGIIFLTASENGLNTLFFKDLYEHAANFNPFWLQISFVFILFGIGTKMGLAPVHFWLPDAHAEAPAPVSALLSAALLNCAFLMIIKVFKITLAAGCSSFPKLMLIVMGFLSLFIAAVFLYHINNYKRMLAYSTIENMGILAIGLALGGAGMFAAMLHAAGHSFIKAAFFMTSGNVLKIFNTKKIKNVKGIINKDKKTGALWILSFLGIAAFPPSILFISEFMIIKTMIYEEKYILCAIFLLLLTIILYGLGRAAINTAFGAGTEENAHGQPAKLPVSMYLPQTVLLILAFIMSIYMPQGVSSLFFQAANAGM